MVQLFVSGLWSVWTWFRIRQPISAPGSATAATFHQAIFTGINRLMAPTAERKSIRGGFNMQMIETVVFFRTRCFQSGCVFSQQSLECVVLRGDFIAVSFEACTWFPCRGTVRNSSLPTYSIWFLQERTAYKKGRGLEVHHVRMTGKMHQRSSKYSGCRPAKRKANPTSHIHCI